MKNEITSVKVNPITRSVALVARGGFSNLNKGDVFGRPVGVAVKLLAAGNADLLDEGDLPKLPNDQKYLDEKVNLQAGTFGSVDALSTKDRGKALADANAKIQALEMELDARDKQIAELTKPANK